MRYVAVAYPNGWSLTGHAQQRMDEMGLTAAEVLSAVCDPQLTYPARPSATGYPREARIRDGLLVIVSATKDVVVTVMWNKASERTYHRRAA